MVLSTSVPDVEKDAGGYTQLMNNSVRSFGWENITVTVKDRQTKLPKEILHDVNGVVQTGKNCSTFDAGTH
jgi:hypothetical protein